MFLKKHKKEQPDGLVERILQRLVRNEIEVHFAGKSGEAHRSRIGGKPPVPKDFVWPYFRTQEGERKPLAFLGMINLEEVALFDKENLLPQKGLLLFFYELASMCWGFDPADRGCARVYYFENPEGFDLKAFPSDLEEEYRLESCALSFASKPSYPSYEELSCHTDAEIDWADYENALLAPGYEIKCERHKLLGYADLIQGEPLTECERTARGLYCGDPESYRKTPRQVQQQIEQSAADWILLFQLASFEEPGCGLMFGDLGNLYFYIKKQDLQKGDFSKVWLILQCG